MKIGGKEYSDEDTVNLQQNMDRFSGQKEFNVWKSKGMHFG